MPLVSYPPPDTVSHTLVSNEVSFVADGAELNLKVMTDSYQVLPLTNDSSMELKLKASSFLSGQKQAGEMICTFAVGARHPQTGPLTHWRWSVAISPAAT